MSGVFGKNFGETAKHAKNRSFARVLAGNGVEPGTTKPDKPYKPYKIPAIPAAVARSSEDWTFGRLRPCALVCGGSCNREFCHALKTGRKGRSMPNRAAHLSAATPIGAATAFLTALDRQPFEIACETAGGVLGARLGARLPDIFDPATSPNHRSVGHGVVPVGTTVATLAKGAVDLKANLREKARELDRMSDESDSVLDALLLQLVRIGCLVLAGAVYGVPAGYLTHLVQDSGTPKGLPLVG